jgi:hypothetical protein
MDKINDVESDEVSVKELVSKLKSSVRYIKSKWIISLVFTIAGALIGIFYPLVIKPTYKAVSTFVLEESGHGGALGSLSQFSGLASLAGLDIGGGSDKGLFQGDNILELYKSRLMLTKTLLTPVEINGKKQLLIERYIEFNNLREKWKNKDNIQSINFNGDPKKFDRKQDSIIRDFTKYFNKRILSITKPDKKLSIISVEVDSKDEIFAQIFDQTLVQTVNDFYIQTQTKKTTQSVRVLQHQADSVRSMLNSSIGKVAASTDANPNPNPTIISLKVPSQKRQIDVQANSAIYSEIVKNLELSKISLRQETPLIQLIDEPILPLDSNEVGKIIGALIGIVSGFFLSILYIIIARFFVFIKNT